jgi:hypothetical protein
VAAKSKHGTAYGLSASADGPYFLYQQGRNALFFYQREDRMWDMAG